MPTEKGIEALLSALGVPGIMALVAVYIGTLGALWQIGRWREGVFRERFRELEARWSKALTGLRHEMHDHNRKDDAQHAREDETREEITGKLARLEVTAEGQERRLESIERKLDRLIDRRAESKA